MPVFVVTVNMQSMARQPIVNAPTTALETPIKSVEDFIETVFIRLASKCEFLKEIP